MVVFLNQYALIFQKCTFERVIIGTNGQICLKIICVSLADECQCNSLHHMARTTEMISLSPVSLLGNPCLSDILFIIVYLPHFTLHVGRAEDIAKVAQSNGHTTFPTVCAWSTFILTLLRKQLPQSHIAKLQENQISLMVIHIQIASAIEALRAGLLYTVMKTAPTFNHAEKKNEQFLKIEHSKANSYLLDFPPFSP